MRRHRPGAHRPPGSVRAFPDVVPLVVNVARMVVNVARGLVVNVTFGVEWAYDQWLS
ncbi:hypothetical protein TPA0910_29210 [Streptomyces hygroscopicus subsp. sporocinereus]|uniref:Uncharacterized protein n=1 Tax=Streptomyces hygroscopicus TaxID=1912 RepID=A0ABQ3TYN1_STRHY|nr:hypothetical protein TPA0910_29210 [Streptomyces hygroscopicus]